MMPDNQPLMRPRDRLHAWPVQFLQGREVEQGSAADRGIVVRREQPQQGQRIFERLSRSDKVAAGD
jgi:hypothetical protein